jgi:UDP-N-acetylmuramoylalanine-D-glutamate ligase
MKTRVAVVGMRYWGKNLVRVFSELGALKTVCDQDTTRSSTIKDTCPDVSFCVNYAERTVFLSPRPQPFPAASRKEPPSPRP